MAKNFEWVKGFLKIFLGQRYLISEKLKLVKMFRFLSWGFGFGGSVKGF